MNRDILNDQPEPAIAAYRTLLTGGDRSPEGSVAIPMDPTAHGLWGDHGVGSVTELLALAIASRIAAVADMAMIGTTPDAIAGELDEEIGVELSQALTHIRQTLQTRFRTHLNERAGLGHERIAALRARPLPVYDDMDDVPF